MERPGPASLLPNQPARRSTLPAGRPAALPRRGRGFADRPPYDDGAASRDERSASRRRPTPAAPRRPARPTGATDGRTSGRRRVIGGRSRPDVALGGPAPVDPAARAPPEPADERGRDRAAIATELRQLIDYHNVRVYRVTGEDLMPVAFEGDGEYHDETRSSSGSGRRGHHRLGCRPAIAQNLPDAANDPRAETIPGTEDDLDESMLLAPMVFEDEVIGVLVLSKLGLDQFSDDDLRLLEIYASLAAQAMVNADSTAAPAGAVGGARTPAPQPARAAAHHRVDPVHARPGRRPRQDHRPAGQPRQLRQHLDRHLRPASQRAHPTDRPRRQRGGLLQPWEPGETGVATGSSQHNEPQLVHRRAGRPAGPPVRLDRAGRRQPDRRPAPRPRGSRRAC